MQNVLDQFPEQINRFCQLTFCLYAGGEITTEELSDDSEYRLTIFIFVLHVILPEWCPYGYSMKNAIQIWR